MAQAGVRHQPAWDEVVGMIRERQPILRLDGGQEVDERVYRVEAPQAARGDGPPDEIAFVTYTGRRVVFRDLTGFSFTVLGTDRQGVPVAYELTLRSRTGDATLRFYA